MNNCASQLRLELSRRAKAYAGTQGVGCYESLGSSLTVLFPADASLGTHGNFIDESYRAVLADRTWSPRLGKSHAQRGALPEEHKSNAKELDSCNSSDAL